MPCTDTVLRTVAATRYVTPAARTQLSASIIEADDAGMYVLKLRSTGQGLNALVPSG